MENKIFIKRKYIIVDGKEIKGFKYYLINENDLNNYYQNLKIFEDIQNKLTDLDASYLLGNIERNIYLNKREKFKEEFETKKKEVIKNE